MELFSPLILLYFTLLYFTLSCIHLSTHARYINKFLLQLQFEGYFLKDIFSTHRDREREREREGGREKTNIIIKFSLCFFSLFFTLLFIFYLCFIATTLKPLQVLTISITTTPTHTAL